MSNTVSINKLANTRVLLLGGTSGIGFAVARVALEHGASIIVASSKESKVRTAVSRLNTLYPDYASRITGRVCDLGDESTLEANVVTLLQQSTAQNTFASPSANEGEVAATADEESEKEGITPLDHIVFTAGDIPNLKPPTDASVDVAFVRSIGTVRFLGAAMVAKHAPNYMRNASSSSIILTSGSVTARPHPGFTFGAAYSAASEGLARGLAVDLAPIRVNVVAPGAVHTELLEAFGDSLEGFLEMAKAMSLVGGVGGPEDVAETYVGLMKDRFVSGALVRSDGGSTLK